MFAATQRTVSTHPAEVLKDLEREAEALHSLHRAISDQLQRLQVEEAVLKKQVDDPADYGKQPFMAQTSDVVTTDHQALPHLNYHHNALELGFTEEKN